MLEDDVLRLADVVLLVRDVFELLGEESRSNDVLEVALELLTEEVILVRTCKLIAVLDRDVVDRREVEEVSLSVELGERERVVL